ncbi:MAG: acyl-[acyl-carrier-protein] thioesterase [Tannerellaceae bacterium]|jgi:acyl-ACP thioesterase|nr:acyl-[acyl-carrier-protein] thioesterase [Tannerellaceae bacterium]
MDPVGLFPFTVDSGLLDFLGRLSIPALGGKLLDAAAAHAGARGFGYNDMRRREATWVLSRLAIELTSYPRLSEEVRLLTWIEGAAGLFTHRCFELADAGGEALGYARSVWAAIDLTTRRPTPLDAGALNAYRTERPCPIGKPGKIPPVEHLAGGEPYRVRYSDLDVNGHLNSIRTMERLLDCFDLEMFRQRTVARFEIAYMAEGRYGMELAFHHRESSPGRYDMAVCHEGKAICRAAVTWQ